MTVEIALLFAVLIAMVYLFLTEKLPVDLTAFLGLVVLLLGGFLTPSEAFTGFSSPAVITMLSIFIVSGALQQTGVGDMIGGRIHAAVGSRERSLIAVVMLSAGVLSAFMPNIAAVAVLMPAVGSIATRAGLPPSRLFMPLSFGAILGGMTTLVGTPPNIIAAEMMVTRGIKPFGLFDFTPLGLLCLGTGTLFMITIGRRLLPSRQRTSTEKDVRDLARVYQLQDRLFSIRLPKDSSLDGLTLSEAQLGTMLNVQVIAILRDGRKRLAPRANSVLHSGDVLFVEGRLGDLQELVRVQGVEVQTTRFGELPRPARGVSAIRMRVREDSSIIGKSLKSLLFRQQFGVVVVGIKRGDKMIRGHLGQEVLKADDEILALGTREQLAVLSHTPDFEVKVVGLSAVKQLHEHAFLIRIPKGSPLVGMTVGSGRIGELVGLTVGGIIRENETLLAVASDEVIRAGDQFLVAGEPESVASLLRLGDIELDTADVPESHIESDEVGVVEASLAPRSALIGETLEEITFRQRYGLQVLAIWREARPIRTGLANLPLRFGDAVLLQGSWERIQKIAADPDFVVLSRIASNPRRAKAPVALGGLLLMIAMVVTGYQPIHVAAFTAAALVVLFRALSMQEAYRAIEWRAIFLIAAVLPVGIAMERTGAALLLANLVTSLAGPLGPYAILSSLIILSSLLSQTLDGAPAIVLLTPVALQTASDLGLGTYAIMMAVALAASAAFMTPFSAKAGLLVMGAGGYKTTDYVKVGTPLTIVILIVLVVLVPLFFPL